MIEALDERLEELGAERRYGCGGSVAWIAWPAGESLADLEELLVESGTSGLILRSPGRTVASVFINRSPGPFEKRVRSVLDGPGTFSMRTAGQAG